ncbi:hypothetical protein ACFY8C_28760 [Streptomyces flavochromogenes]|jgi:hypothetical protein|uniref:Secreted protein n=1 Tax=Streptomyces flavochromogenes TaxID=68199 RepID=A0ABW6XY79_9ACTN|nr:hypothetical protein [Streptomyces flavochromogenes]
MSTGTILALVVPAAVLVVLIVSSFALDRRLRHRPREPFGPEKRHDSHETHPLPDHVRDRYVREWQGVQKQFVDRPEAAVHDADRLVTVLMRERGYPTEDFEHRGGDLSAEHGHALERYQEAHEIDLLAATHRATPEQLRGAMVHYRALFDALLSGGDQAGP